MSNLIFWPLVAGPIAASSPLAHDPYFSSVVQLDHMDGPIGFSTPFTNSCPRGTTFARQGSSSGVFSANRIYGTASFYSSGSTNYGIRAPTSTDYVFGTGDWTIEFWVDPDSLARNSINNAKVYYDMRDSVLTAAWVPTISASNGTGNIRYFANGAERIAGANVMSAATWNYVALCRNSGTTRLFHGLAGGSATQVGSDFADTNTYVQGPISMGFAGNGAGETAMRIDEVRVTNGVGRYTTTFAVPSGPFPNQ